jgi:hypothetical protein
VGWFRRVPRGRPARPASVHSFPVAAVAVAPPVPQVQVQPVAAPEPAPVVQRETALPPPPPPPAPLVRTAALPVDLPSPAPTPVSPSPLPTPPLDAAVPLELLDVLSPAPGAPLVVDDAVRPAWVAAPVPYVPPSAAPAPAGPRVELGFADGTYRMLDPQSSAAQKLNDLVAELTRPSGTDGSAGR